MRLLRRKRTVSIDEYCRDYYDKEVFCVQSPGVNTDLVNDWVADARLLLTDSWPPIGKVDWRLLQRELSAARLELFAIAWLDEFERGQSILPHSAFTRRYIKQIDRTDIWASMSAYNEVIARAGALVNGVVDSNLVSRLDRKKSDMLSQWVRKGFDEESIIRVANRLLTTIEPQNTALHMMANQFIDCIGRSQDRAIALSPVSELMFGFYKEARNGLSGINLREGLSLKWF